MLPLLTPIPSTSEGVRFAPPKGFRAVTDLQAAWRSQRGPTFLQKEDRPSIAQLDGIRFEKKVHKIFEDLHLSGVQAGPWFTFRDAFGLRWCQPDILIEFAYGNLIIEAKHNHTTDAWFQLRQLYEPVIAKALDATVRCLVVTEHFDPAVVWPEDFDLLEPKDFGLWLKESKKMGIIHCPKT